MDTEPPPILPKGATRMKHLFIVNPCAGKFDRSHELQTRVSAFMAGRNLDWEIVVTRYAGHAIEYAAKAPAAGVNSQGLPGGGGMKI